MRYTILITGIAGLFGNNFARYLLGKNYNIVGIDNFSGGYKENLPDGVDFINVDLTDRETINNIFCRIKPDYVYHFAAYAAEGLSHHARYFNYQNNTLASTNVISACVNAGCKKIIFTSSMAVYGDFYSPPFTEEMLPNPIDPYGISKYATELDLKTANSYFDLDYTIIRPHNVIGKYQNIWDKYRNVIGIWVRQIIDNKPITIFGDGSQKRAFTDIRSYNQPMEKLMNQCSKEIINIGSDNPITIKNAAEIVKTCAHNFGFNPDIQYLEKRKEAQFAYCNHAKAKELLGFVDNTILENTVNEMFEWALSQPKREVKMMNYEIEKGIYSYWKQ